MQILTCFSNSAAERFCYMTGIRREDDPDNRYKFVYFDGSLMEDRAFFDWMPLHPLIGNPNTLIRFDCACAKKYKGTFKLLNIPCEIRAHIICAKGALS